MRSPVFSLTRLASPRPAHIARRLIVLAVGFAAAGHVLAAPAQPAVQQLPAYTQADARPDGNVDYPSQIGPNGPRLEQVIADARPAPQRTVAVRANWNVDYPSQLGPDGPLVADDTELVTESAPHTTLSVADADSIWNIDYPSQIGPEGPRVNAP
jgi:hypothetical protein